MTAAPGVSPVMWLMDGGEGYGVRRSSVTLAHTLRREGIDSNIVCLRSEAAYREFASSGLGPVSLGVDERLQLDAKGVGFVVQAVTQACRSLGLLRRLVAMIRSTRPQWIYVRFNALMPLAGLAGRLTGTPVVWLLPNRVNDKLPFGLQPRSYQAISRLLGITAVANSEDTARSLGRGLIRVHVAHLGVDQDYFDPESFDREAERRRLGISPEEVVLLIAARLVPDKAQDLVLEALGLLDPSSPPVRLLIAGGPLEGDYSRKLQETAARLTRHSVSFLGLQEDVRPLLAACDVLVNSRRNAEPFGFAIIEAMMMERPVLAYALGGPSETILDGETGWLIPDATVEGYSRGIKRALGDRARWRELGRRGREHSLVHFSARAFAGRIRRIAEAAVASRRGP